MNIWYKLGVVGMLVLGMLGVQQYAPAVSRLVSDTFRDYSATYGFGRWQEQSLLQKEESRAPAKLLEGVNKADEEQIMP